LIDWGDDGSPFSPEATENRLFMGPSSPAAETPQPDISGTMDLYSVVCTGELAVPAGAHESLSKFA
jgi:hypothetical protein